LFFEDFGNTAPSNTPFPNVSNYTGFSKSGAGAENVVYQSDGNITIRSTLPSNFTGASRGSNVFIAGAGGSFFVRNIETLGSSSFLLSFGVNAPIGAFSVAYQVNGTDAWVNLDAETPSSNWNLIEGLHFSLPDKTHLFHLRFTALETSLGVRFDDIRVLTTNAPKHLKISRGKLAGKDVISIVGTYEGIIFFCDRRNGEWSDWSVTDQKKTNIALSGKANKVIKGGMKLTDLVVGDFVGSMKIDTSWIPTPETITGIRYIYVYFLNQEQTEEFELEIWWDGERGILFSSFGRLFDNGQWLLDETPAINMYVHGIWVFDNLDFIENELPISAVKNTPIEAIEFVDMVIDLIDVDRALHESVGVLRNDILRRTDEQSGVWTPRGNIPSNAGGGAISNATGVWHRIGRRIFFSGRFLIPPITNNFTLTVLGIPFSVRVISQFIVSITDNPLPTAFPIPIYRGDAGSGTQLIIRIDSSENTRWINVDGNYER